MYVASLVFLGAAAATLALGVQREGLELVWASVACSGIAIASVLASLVRRSRG